MFRVEECATELILNGIFQNDKISSNDSNYKNYNLAKNLKL